MERAVDVIGAELSWGGPYQLEHALYGSADGAVMAGLVSRWCERNLGAAPAAQRFYRSSVASVHGLELVDGRSVVVHVFRPEHVDDRLMPILDAQRALSAIGYPCPRPLAGPASLSGGVATAETLIDGGRPPDPDIPLDRRRMARGYAALVAATDRAGLAASDGLARPWLLTGEATGALYPPPHDLRFDFDGTAPGAAWIDEAAARAREVLAEGVGNPVVTHLDWRTEHVRVDGDRVVAVYDWDSLALDREPAAAGRVAAVFTANWHVERAARLPTVTEALAFLAEYERCRRAFSPDERRAAEAGVQATLAYFARCEHSDAVRFGRPGPGGRAALRAWLAR